MNSKKILITICARGGSKGLPSKNIKPLLGKPLIAHTIELAKRWARAEHVVVSTDSEEILEIAKQFGAETPFLRPAHLATDHSGKIPVITHALESAEAFFNQTFDTVLDLDPTAPMRNPSDLETALDTFDKTGADVCFSVVKARKNPYFNMVEKDEKNKIHLVKKLENDISSRQKAPQVFDMNASIYVYRRSFLKTHPESLWTEKLAFFEMGPETAFDIDFERDFVIVEALMRQYGKSE